MSVSISSLGEYLQLETIKKVVMESTSTYCVPVWDILYEMDLDLTLVNPLHIKQMPNRKSDAKDAQWIAELLHKRQYSTLPLIQELRSYTREYRLLVQQRTNLIHICDPCESGAQSQIS